MLVDELVTDNVEDSITTFSMLLYELFAAKFEYPTRIPACIIASLLYEIIILASDENNKLIDYDSILTLPTSINEINSIVERLSTKKIFNKNSSISIKKEYVLDKNEKFVGVLTSDKLLEILYKEHREQPYLLIDEYDTPIQHAYTKKYYDAMISFMRRFFGASLKGNTNIKKSFVIGLLFIIFPITPLSVVLFSIFMGSLWLATVPLTSGLIAHIYGLRYMGTLYGLVFLSHQLGSFLGVWMGGRLYDATGDYTLVWWIGIGVSAK